MCTSAFSLKNKLITIKLSHKQHRRMFLIDTKKIKYILGDGSINVWDDDFVIPIPKVDGAFAAARALVLCCDAERHIIGSFL